MKFGSLSHVPGHIVLHNLKTLLTCERASTADVLHHLAEVEERKLYLPAAYPSMYQYCLQELHFSEDAAYKRIQAARAGRKFPAILHAVADGRLHLSAVVLLAPHLRPDNVDQLLAAAAHKSRSQIAQLLAERFPRPAVPTRLEPVLMAIAPCQLVSKPVDAPALEGAPGPVALPAPGPVVVPAARPVLAPLSAEDFELRMTVRRVAHDKLRYAQALLGHAVPSRDLPEVFERALDALIEKLERQVFAATVRPRPRRGEAKGRHIPAEFRRAVWHRDGGQCTFVSKAGERCSACSRLEFDHIEPVARGGATTAANLRLRCRAHNQYTAECEFGVSFMDRKRKEAKSRRARTHTKVAVKASPRVTAPLESTPELIEARARGEEAIPWLRRFRADEAPLRPATCEDTPEAPLENRVSVALSEPGRPR